MTTRRSATVSASSWSWVTMTVVRSELALQLADFDAHLLAQLGVEIGQRLVEQQHVGPKNQRTGQRHALLLAAGQLSRQPVAEMIEPHQPQRLGDLRRHLRLRHLAHLEAERDVLGHRHVRKQRIALEHQAGVALPWRQRGDVALAQAHAARRRLDEAGDDPQGRGLAAAGRAEQDQKLAIADVDRNVIDRLEVAVAFGDPVNCRRAMVRPRGRS